MVVSLLYMLNFPTLLPVTSLSVIIFLPRIGDYKEWIDENHDLALKRFNEQAQVANKVLKTADNSLWKCDPEKHVPGKTYTEMTRLLQVNLAYKNGASHTNSLITFYTRFCSFASFVCSINNVSVPS